MNGSSPAVPMRGRMPWCETTRIACGSSRRRGRTGSSPFDSRTLQFSEETQVPSGGGVVRHMFYASSDEKRFGSAPTTTRWARRSCRRGTADAADALKAVAQPQSHPIAPGDHCRSYSAAGHWHRTTISRPVPRAGSRRRTGFATGHSYAAAATAPARERSSSPALQRWRAGPNSARTRSARPNARHRKFISSCPSNSCPVELSVSTNPGPVSRETYTRVRCLQSPGALGQRLDPRAHPRALR